MKNKIVWAVIIISFFSNGCRKIENPPGPQTENTVTGIWEGTTDGRLLRLLLTEVSRDSITGLITVSTQTLIDTFWVRRGMRIGMDSLLIETYFWGTQTFVGRLINIDQAQGQRSYRYINDPPILEHWSAQR